jgi:cell wall-associated NlpC family hydrolase
MPQNPPTIGSASPTYDPLEKSALAPVPQMELMGGDVDLAEFDLAMEGIGGIALRSAITDARIDRTIEGASTLTVTVNDDADRTIETSGRLGKHSYVNLNGLWFTLVQVNKQGHNLSLTFEDREVNLLRYYNSFIKADRAKVTRAEFVLRMIEEVKEISMKWIIPELHDEQLIDDRTQPGQIIVDAQGNPTTKDAVKGQDAMLLRDQAISTSVRGLTTKGARAGSEQINNASIILRTGVAMGARPKVLVAAIMTGITESSLTNLTMAVDHDSLGVFQQRPSQGWPASNDVSIDARAFYEHAIAEDKKYPNLSYAMLCQNVQRSAYSDGSNYAPWQGEAEEFVTQFGAQVPKSPKVAGRKSGTPSASNNQYAASGITSGAQFFIRGKVTQPTGQSSSGAYLMEPESSWDCMKRLAQEVQWRVFVVSGTVYFVSEPWLWRSKPFMVINEDDDGIDFVNYDYDEGKKVATVTVICHLSRWSAPPGSIIQIQGQSSIVDGRYIVNEVSRSLFESVATITLKKPLPVLPEPTTIGGGELPSGFLGAPAQPSDTTINEDAATTKTDIQDRIIKYAQSQLGVPYVYGAETKDVSFDCSGLTEAAYSSVGINIPRVAQAQYDFGPVGSQVELMQPADLVYFSHSGSTGAISHVGIYIGNGKMIHAPHSGSVVKVVDGFKEWTDPQYVGFSKPWKRGPDK